MFKLCLLNGRLFVRYYVCGLWEEGRLVELGGGVKYRLVSIIEFMVVCEDFYWVSWDLVVFI